MLNLSANQKPPQSRAETQQIREYWRKYGIELLKEKNPTYSECKAAAIGNRASCPELADDLMAKAKKWKKPKI